VIITEKDWSTFVRRMAALSQKAADEIKRFIDNYGGYDATPRDELLTFAYYVVKKYGEGAATLAALMYDAVAELEEVSVEPAEPADTATYDETAKALQGAAKFSKDPLVIAAAASRLVKMAGLDTTMRNAIRDGAQYAWVAYGDTCPYCLMLAAQGWQYASADTLEDGHARHVHGHCDCTFATRFKEGSGVRGYNPDRYKRIIYNADTGVKNPTVKDRINAVRREEYAKNKETINEQKRDAYERHKALEDADEVNVDA